MLSDLAFVIQVETDSRNLPFILKGTAVLKIGVPLTSVRPTDRTRPSICTTRWA
jgi:hypothetical protein